MFLQNVSLHPDKKIPELRNAGYTISEVLSWHFAQGGFLE
jgi:hypothetical protein